jgi:hypothetical protein
VRELRLRVCRKRSISKAASLASRKSRSRFCESSRRVCVGDADGDSACLFVACICSAWYVGRLCAPRNTNHAAWCRTIMIGGLEHLVECSANDHSANLCIQKGDSDSAITAIERRTHLTRTSPDLVQFGVPEKAACRVVVDVAISTWGASSRIVSSVSHEPETCSLTKTLDGIKRNLGCVLSTIENDARAVVRLAVSAIARARHRVQICTACAQLGVHVSHLSLQQLRMPVKPVSPHVRCQQQDRTWNSPMRVPNCLRL